MWFDEALLYNEKSQLATGGGLKRGDLTIFPENCIYFCDQS